MTDLDEILSHLPEDKVRELKIITQRIVGTGKAEIIILVGSYARGDYKDKRGEAKGKKSDYDILAATSDFGSKKDLRSESREIFKDIGIPVQLIVERIDFLNSNLEETQYFYTDIKREGKILFNSGKYELAESKDLSPTRRRKIAEKDFKMWVNRAKRFFIDQENATNRNDFSLASFYLQQVAEHLKHVEFRRHNND